MPLSAKLERGTIADEMVVTMLMVLPDHLGIEEAREGLGRSKATIVVAAGGISPIELDVAQACITA